jgi:hypothetical protein
VLYLLTVEGWSIELTPDPYVCVACNEQCHATKAAYAWPTNKYVPHSTKVPEFRRTPSMRSS